MVPLDVAKELSDILTSAFGKGWGWAVLLLLARALKKRAVYTGAYKRVGSLRTGDRVLGSSHLTHCPLCATGYPRVAPRRLSGSGVKNLGAARLAMLMIFDFIKELSEPMASFFGEGWFVSFLLFLWVLFKKKAYQPCTAV